MARWEPTSIPMDDNYSIEITTNPRQITEGVDPRWVGKDRAGHEHRGSDLRATLTAVTEDCYCDLVDEPHTVFVRWECSTCGEEITPRNLSEWNPYTLLDPPTARVSNPDGDEWDVYDVASLRERIATGQEINVAFLDTVGTRTSWSVMPVPKWIWHCERCGKQGESINRPHPGDRILCIDCDPGMRCAFDLPPVVPPPDYRALLMAYMRMVARAEGGGGTGADVAMFIEGNDDTATALWWVAEEAFSDPGWRDED